MSKPVPTAPMKHSPAWIAQTWISFALSIGLTMVGIYGLPLDIWIKGFLLMGVVFSIASAVSLTKTMRDQYEAEQMAARIDEARVSKLISEHDPLRVSKQA